DRDGHRSTPGIDVRLTRLPLLHVFETDEAWAADKFLHVARHDRRATFRVRKDLDAKRLAVAAREVPELAVIFCLRALIEGARHQVAALRRRRLGEYGVSGSLGKGAQFRAGGVARV